MYKYVLFCKAVQSKQKPRKASKYRLFGAFFIGADSQIRTGDLILTKDYKRPVKSAYFGLSTPFSTPCSQSAQVCQQTFPGADP